MKQVNVNTKSANSEIISIYFIDYRCINAEQEDPIQIGKSMLWIQIVGILIVEEQRVEKCQQHRNNLLPIVVINGNMLFLF